MKKYQFLIVALGAISLLMSSFFIIDSDTEADQAQPLNRVGFVNIKKIFKDYKKVKDMNIQLLRVKEKEEAKMKKLEEEIKLLKEEIPMFRVGSDVRKAKEKKLIDKVYEMEVTKKKAQYYLREDKRKGIETIYREVVEEVEAYSKQKKYLMIVSVSEADFFGVPSEEALLLQISTRNILAWTPERDITKQILARLENNYQKNQNPFGSK